MNPSAPPVLLLTHSGDYYTIDRVEEGLDRRGFRHLRVDTDRYPSELALTARVRDGGVERWLEAAGHSFRLDQVPAIWCRRLWPGRLPAEMDPRLAAHCGHVSRISFFEVFHTLRGPRMVNPLGPQDRAESKLYQLEVATRVGLRVPDTLITNRGPEVPPFFAAHGRIITKLPAALSQTMDASGDFVYTSEVRAEHLERLDELRWAPQIFQPLVHKVRELRVIVVGDRFFCGAVDTRASPRAELDWRKATSADGLCWTEDRLPAFTQAQVRALMAELGLVYGALDFLVDDQPEPVFLEINPAGEWGWLERDLGLPIGDAIAEALVGARR
jgi:glutathione synthase/RimK-type ligase-like ATP-grasp enzyme